MTTESIYAQNLNTTENHHPFSEDESIEIPPEPAIYRKGKLLILENGASLPSHVCLKSGLAAKRGAKVTLRSPFNPFTWLKGYQKTTIGLSHKQFDNYRVLCALAWSLIGLGLVMIGVGLLPVSSTAIAGLLFVLGGGIVRAVFPVWGSFEGSNRVVVHGCGERYLELFPELTETGQ